MPKILPDTILGLSNFKRTWRFRQNEKCRSRLIFFCFQILNEEVQILNEEGNVTHKDDCEIDNLLYLYLKLTIYGHKVLARRFKYNLDMLEDDLIRHGKILSLPFRY